MTDWRESANKAPTYHHVITRSVNAPELRNLMSGTSGDFRIRTINLSIFFSFCTFILGQDAGLHEINCSFSADRKGCYPATQCCESIAPCAEARKWS